MEEPSLRKGCSKSISERAEPDIMHFKNIPKTYFFRLTFDLLG